MNYHNITYPDMNNGEGLRVVLWLSGCDHHCLDCQNPQTWNPNSGILFDDAAREELFRELSKDYISGLTLSGGDPLYKHNLNEVLELLLRFRVVFGQTKTIWLYTGYTWEDIWMTKQLIAEDVDEEVRNVNKKRQDIVKLCDVVVDGEYKKQFADVGYEWAGSTNQKVISVQDSLKVGNIVLFVEEKGKKNEQ